MLNYLQFMFMCVYVYDWLSYNYLCHLTIGLINFLYLTGSVYSYSYHTAKLCFHQRTICNHGPDSLSCPENHVIRLRSVQVKQKTSGNVNNCAGCNNIGNDRWENVTDNDLFTTLVYLACSRKNVCDFTSSDIVIREKEDNYIWTADIMYECIEKGV